MASAALTVAAFAPSSKSSLALPVKTFASSTNRFTLNKVRLHHPQTTWYASVGRKPAFIRAQAPKVAKLSKKDNEGVVTNKFKPDNPYIGKCLQNTKITGESGPAETWHVVISTGGELPYREGQSIGVIPDGVDQKPRLYSAASSALGDLGDSKTVSLCVQRAGAGSSFICDLKPGAEVKLTGPVGTELLMPKDPNANIIMLATGTGIAPFRGFLWKMFNEKHDDYKFNGLSWLFFEVPTSSSLLYKEELEKMKEKEPDKLRLDYAISGEQTNDKGEKMHIQTRMAQYGEELWELLKKENTYVYLSGMKSMVEGIDDLMVSLAAKDGIDWMNYKKEMEKGEQWSAVVY